VFIAVPGLQSDGREFIHAAIASGASFVLCHEHTSDQHDRTQGIRIRQEQNVWFVQGLTEHLGELASIWYGEPSKQLKVIALTGTNGKTSCTQWLTQTLSNLGHQVGAIGTLGVTSLNGLQQYGALTTPDVISVHRQLATFVAQGAEYVVMEASSIGLEQGRLNGVNVDLAGFLNLTHDHLDYHGDMQSYANAKALLFQLQTLSGVVINQDDPYADVMIKSCKAPIVFFGMTAKAAVQAQHVTENEAGISFDLSIDNEVVPVQLPFFGTHNASNLLCVASLLHLLEFSLTQIVESLRALKVVPGRMEPVSSPIESSTQQPLVLVDFAHTPDALAHVLSSSRHIAQKRQGRLWCVLGCGGDRDTAKRSVMGEIASLKADHVLVTSDNPRSESPDLIIQQIMSGVKAQVNAESVSVRIMSDRAQAILRGVLDAAPTDVVVIAGKGHESGQDIKGVTYPFDDRQWAAAGLLLRQSPMFETDSRALTPGSVFIAIEGEQFDGHSYLSQVQQLGATAAIVNEVNQAVNLPQIALGNTRQALMTLATAWRQCFDMPVIGVTGSNGKTTTKEMIAAGLSAAWGSDGYLATQGNLNNELGVPLTVLRLRHHHRAAVIELGMNHPGEIALISQCAQPTIGLVLNAQREHQEFMHSVQAVAQENAAVFTYLLPRGVAVFPAADTYTELWQTMSQAHQALTFGQDKSAMFNVSDVVPTQLGGHLFSLNTPNEHASINLPIPGLHNIMNAAAACACVWAAGIPLRTMALALQNFGAVKGRMMLHHLSNHQILIDDTYNANPDSVRAAIDVLVSLPPPRLLVLGDMGEVGHDTAAMHAEVGHYAQQSGVDHLLAMGQDTRYTVKAFGQQAQRFETPEEVCVEIMRRTPRSILVKGSRFMKMERVIGQYMSAEQLKETQHLTHCSGEKHAV
jgi:murE/murF fusion protein